jgi:hypothetical protein
MQEVLEAHTSELMILVLTSLVLISLWILVPRLLHARHQHLEMLHAEQMKALEQGTPLPRPNEAVLAAGRTATLVPMVSICAAATVTCFLGAYKTESMFAITLAAWSVVGVVSLAAITGGVALMGRIVQPGEAPEPEEEATENPLE